MIIKNYRTRTIIKYSVFYLVPIIFLCYLYFTNKIDLTKLIGNDILQYQFNIITINSIFAGFLFTGLSIIIGVSDKRGIKFLFEANRMGKIYGNIYLGIVVNLISMLFCILIIGQIALFDAPVLIFAELTLIIIGVLSLLVSIHHIRKLTKYINKDNSKE